MKKILAGILLITIVLASKPTIARDYKFFFWYPGEAGTTADAEPVVASLFEYLGAKLDGVNFSGKYINRTDEGVTELNKIKPDFAIASFVALEDNKAKLPAFTKLASTRPFPNGTTEDQFVIAGKAAAGSAWTPPAKLNIISSIPISVDFFKKQLAPDITVNVTIRTTDSILANLKKIASGELADTYALLTPMENYTFEKMNSDWKKGVSTLYKCKSIPTAELVYFGGKPDVAEKLLAVLTAMPSDPEGQEILETLRLKGFK